MDKRPASVRQGPPSAPRRLAGAGSSQGSDRKKARIEMDEDDDEDEEEEEQDKRPKKRRKKVVPVEGNAVVVDPPLAEQAEFISKTGDVLGSCECDIILCGTCPPTSSSPDRSPFHYAKPTLWKFLFEAKFTKTLYNKPKCWADTARLLKEDLPMGLMAYSSKSYPKAAAMPKGEYLNELPTVLNKILSARPTIFAFDGTGLANMVLHAFQDQLALSTKKPKQESKPIIKAEGIKEDADAEEKREKKRGRILWDAKRIGFLPIYLSLPPPIENANEGRTIVYFYALTGMSGSNTVYTAKEKVVWFVTLYEELLKLKKDRTSGIAGKVEFRIEDLLEAENVKQEPGEEVKEEDVEIEVELGTEGEVEAEVEVEVEGEAEREVEGEEEKGVEGEEEEGVEHEVEAKVKAEGIRIEDDKNGMVKAEEAKKDEKMVVKIEGDGIVKMEKEKMYKKMIVKNEGHGVVQSEEEQEDEKKVVKNEGEGIVKMQEEKAMLVKNEGEGIVEADEIVKSEEEQQDKKITVKIEDEGVVKMEDEKDKKMIVKIEDAAVTQQNSSRGSKRSIQLAPIRRQVKKEAAQ